MAMVDIEIRLTGASILLMHNERLANPMDPIAQEIKKVTDKKKKTDEDQEILRRLEWIGGLYTTPDNRVTMPSKCVRACLRNAARASKLGRHVERALSFPDLNTQFEYDGPADIKELYDQGNHANDSLVKVRQSKVLRTRPMFETWGVIAKGLLLTDIMDPQELSDIAAHAGRIEGLCDNRTNGFGRFTAEITVI